MSRRRRLALAGSSIVVAAGACAAAACLLTVHADNRNPRTFTAGTMAAPVSRSAADATAGWSSYTDPLRRFALRVPPSWHVFGPCPVGQTSADKGTETRLAPHDNVCGADATNDDIVVDVEPASSVQNAAECPPGCSTSQPVQVNGVAGHRTQHLANACGDYPRVWYEFTAAGWAITIAFNGASFCDFSMAPAPPAKECTGERGDFTATLDEIVRQTISFGG